MNPHAIDHRLKKPTFQLDLDRRHAAPSLLISTEETILYTGELLGEKTAPSRRACRDLLGMTSLPNFANEVQFSFSIAANIPALWQDRSIIVVGLPLAFVERRSPRGRRECPTPRPTRKNGQPTHIIETDCSLLFNLQLGRFHV